MVKVVGVAASVSQMGLDGERFPVLYFPHVQEGSREMTAMIRTLVVRRR